MKKVTIIGHGRFGQTLHRLLNQDFALTIYTRKPLVITSEATRLPTPGTGGQEQSHTTSLQEAYESDVIFYAVPIASFEEVIKEHKQYFRSEHVLIDVLSVKMHPRDVFEKELKNFKTQALLTHPMFGPDSSKNGFENLPMILDKFKSTDETYEFWKNYFEKKKLRIIEMSPEEHDRLAADSQGLTHFIGRLLDEYGLQTTSIDSLGTKKLLEVREQTCNDTWELFTGLQHYNPYTKKMRLRLGEMYDKLYNRLLPKQVNPNHITIGIQGGKGSFNEEAIQYYLNRNNISKYEIKYLHTSENVLRALHEGNIDQGIFAMHNSVGGIVKESVETIAKYKFKIIEEFAIKITHTLMIHKDASLQDITTIMTHPQSLAQCKITLLQKYPTLKQSSGEGELIDHALVAKELSEEKLPKEIAVMGSKVLADLYGLKIVETDLQDLKENYTSFLLVER